MYIFLVLFASVKKTPFLCAKFFSFLFYLAICEDKLVTGIRHSSTEKGNS